MSNKGAIFRSAPPPPPPPLKLPIHRQPPGLKSSHAPSPRAVFEELKLILEWEWNNYNPRPGGRKCSCKWREEAPKTFYPNKKCPRYGTMSFARLVSSNATFYEHSAICSWLAYFCRIMNAIPPSRGVGWKLLIRIILPFGLYLSPGELPWKANTKEFNKSTL